MYGYTHRHIHCPYYPLKAGANTRTPSFHETGTYTPMYTNKLTLIDIDCHNLLSQLHLHTITIVIIIAKTGWVIA